MPRVHPIRRRRGAVFLALLLLAPATLFAGGGPFNTLVVVNTNSLDSIELGDYYAAAHGIPDHHICRLGITNLTTVTSNEFRTLLLAPVTNHIASENLGGQIDFLVLCQDFPTRVNNIEGISASLFYGFKNAPSYEEAGCNLPGYASNAYYRAERAFRSADGWNSTNGFVAFHLIAADLDTAKAVADRGVAARSSFPSSAIYLHMLGARYRRVREALYANAQFSFTALPGLPVPCVLAPHYTNLNGQTNVMGYQDGYGYIPDEVRTNNVWMPGAYADHLTSCGGMIPDPCFNQATVFDWMDIGATASFGTVAEPCNYLAKFPDPLMAFYYARGFTIGEAYSMSVESPYQGLFAGDPLAAPFAAPPVLSSPSHSPGQIVTGAVPVQVSATAHSRGVPAAALDFYLDGRFLTNLATLGPTPGNRLSLVVAGLTNAVAVETNDTLFDAVAALADAVNGDPSSIVSAQALGDRLELIYTNFNHAADQAPVSASVSTGTASVLTLGVGLAATNLIPSVYPARKQIWISEHAIWTGANTNDTLTCVITLTNDVAVTNTIIAAQGESVTNLLVRLGTSINAHPTLQATNGVRFDYLAFYLPNVAEDGALFARKPGPDGAKIRVDFTITPAHPHSGLSTNGTFSGALDDNPDDVRPRASVLFHVRPTNGVLAATASFDATALPDGVHTLDFVARDGSAVAASSRFSLPLVVCNASAQLALLGTNGAAVADGEAPSLAAGTDFGPVEWGQSITNTFAILNNGSATLAITSWTTNGPGAAAFQVSGIPSAVAAGGSSNFFVVFSPASGGAYEASLAFDSGALVPQTNLLFAGTGAPRDQTLSFPPISDQLVTNLVGLSATATSGLDVSFSVASGPASIADGTNLSFSAPGTVSVVAAQSGDADWNPAPEVTNTFSVSKAAASVTLGNLAQTYDGTARTATAATVPAGLAVDFTYDGSGTAPTAVGIYAVTGTVNEALYQGSATGALAVTEAIESGTVGSNDIEVVFGPLAVGVPYDLLCTTSLTTGSWEVVDTRMGAGEANATLTHEDGGTNRMGYYRINGAAGPSIEIWGYVKMDKPGDSWLNVVGIPFHTGAQTLGSLMDPLEFSGHHNNAGLADQVMVWNAGEQSYLNLALYDLRAFGEEYADQTGWKLSDGFGPAADYVNPVLPAGSAVWIRGSTTNDRTVTLAGEVVMDGAATNEVVAGLQLVSNPFSETVGLSNLAIHVHATGHYNNAGLADQIMAWDAGTQAYLNLALYDLRSFGEEYADQTGWKLSDGFGPAADYVNPQFDPGEGFWIRAVNGGFEWVETNKYKENLE